MSSIKYIDYNSKSILYLDFEGVASDHEVIELGEKASRLVKLGSRNKIFMLYNLTDLEFTRRIMANLNRLMANADLVERRVLFGADPKYDQFLEKLVQMLRLDRNTKFCVTYTDAVNVMTDDSGWTQERRHINLPVQQDQRRPVKVYTEQDFLDFGLGEGRITLLPEFKGWDKE